ncbi:RNA polymerase sigma factor [Planctomycetaceae bacterium SH139]
MLELAKRNDSPAWDRIIEIFGPSVYQWCRRSGLGATDAATLTQAVFRSAYAGLADFESDGRGAGFRHWLLDITISMLVEFIGSKNSASKKPSKQMARDGCNELADQLGLRIYQQRHRENVLRVRRAIHCFREEFPSHTWQAFWRASAGNEQISKISASLDMSNAAVCASRSRVMRVLRETLAGLVELPEEF